MANPLGLQAAPAGFELQLTTAWRSMTSDFEQIDGHVQPPTIRDFDANHASTTRPAAADTTDAEKVPRLAAPINSSGHASWPMNNATVKPASTVGVVGEAAVELHAR